MIMKTLETIRTAAAKAANRVTLRTSLVERESILIDELVKEGIKPEKIFSVGEKPAKGASFSTVEMKDRFRVNYRCGYSRCNYAPCIEILK